MATTSDSARSTIGGQSDPPPSADSPFRSRTYAEFITDEELQRAKAEVEECYRRRAWRVRLGDSSLSTLVERGGALSPLPLPTPASLATGYPLPPLSPLRVKYELGR